MDMGLGNYTKKKAQRGSPVTEGPFNMTLSSGGSLVLEIFTKVLTQKTPPTEELGIIGVL